MQSVRQCIDSKGEIQVSYKVTIREHGRREFTPRFVPVLEGQNGQPCGERRAHMGDGEGDEPLTAAFTGAAANDVVFRSRAARGAGGTMVAPRFVTHSIGSSPLFCRAWL